jgi:DNA-directed RNA polymerase specialized sigma24 family protein
VSKGARVSEDVVNFYYDRVCGAADTLFRFAYAVTLDLNEANKLVQEAYRDIASDLEKLAQEESAILPKLIKQCWAQMPKSGAGKVKSASTISKLFGGMQPQVRAVVAASDMVGMSVTDVSDVLGLNADQVRSALAQGRDQLLKADADT